MSAKLSEQLARFAAETTFESLPADVVEESKRIILDSIGCGLGAVNEPKGKIGIDFGKVLAPAGGEATIIGSTERSSEFGAAFANAELINALDYDIVLPPGHVTPYVLPVIMAVGEYAKSSGPAVILTNAIAHEMTNRFGKAMDGLRDTKDGQVDTPPVFGYSSSIFGATAAALRLRGQNAEVTAHGLGIAANISPVNPQVSWFSHPPFATIKYLLGGHTAQSALTAAYMAMLGHRGDLEVFDDAEFGYRRFIGSRKWNPEPLVAEIGTRWNFPAELSYKPYPHCRILHAPLDILNDVMTEHNLTPDEIDGIKVYVEGFVTRPVWMNRDIKHVHDAQFSVAHGIALGAHRAQPGRAWQDPDLVYSQSVMDLMKKVTVDVHPDYVKLLSGVSASRPGRIEITARGQTFEREKRIAKGVRSSDETTYMTNDQLITKFRNNAEGVLAPAQIDELVNEVMALEKVTDFAAVMRKAGQAASREGRRVA